MPLHNKTIRPVKATATRNRVRVKNINTAFHGGNLALADFQVTPPFGRIIADTDSRNKCDKEAKKDESARRRVIPASLGGRLYYRGQVRRAGGRNERNGLRKAQKED